jgi:DNA mismatch endonuclease (patch repair protein)
MLPDLRMMKRVATTTDAISPERSAQMALVRDRDTKPEMRVRKALHRAGLRYRLHDKRLPGKPDIVFPSRKIAVFVHGCFWHRHASSNCKLARLPKSRLDFWLPKLQGNFERDKIKQAALRALGWRVIVIWECEVAADKNLAALVKQVKAKHAAPRPRAADRGWS